MRKMALVLLAACGGGSDNHHMVVLADAAPDVAADVIDAPPNQGFAVELDVFGDQPSFIAYRDGTGPWQTPTASQGRYTLYATDTYQAVVVCSSAGGSSATLVEATPDDGQQFVFCSAPSSSTPTTVAVTGQMTQPGRVVMDDEAESTTGNWTFSLNVAPGTKDLFALDTSHRMLIRRDVSVTGATTVDPVDVAADGAAMPALTLTLNGTTAGDQLYNGIELLTSNGFVDINSDTTSLDVPPTALLTPNDYLFIYAEAFSGNQVRYGEAQFTGNETTYNLPAPLTGVTFGTGSVGWGTLPSYESLELDVSQTRGQLAVSQTVQATSRWIAAAQASSLAFDVQPDGYDASWNVDTAMAYDRRFNLSYFTGGISYGVSLADSTTLQRQRAKRPWFSAVERVRASMRSQHTMPRR